MSEEIFSRQRRRLARARALRAAPDSRWIRERMVDELAERLSFMAIDVRRALVIGDGAARLAHQLQDADLYRMELTQAPGTAVVAEEDRLPIGDATMDLVFAAGTLDTVHDLPGALVLIRRILRPGGLFLGAMLGAGSLPSLRERISSAEAALNRPHAARFHPQVDVRAAGDLLFRAGFSTPVADHDVVAANYTTAKALIDDIRATTPNALPTVRPLAKQTGQDLLSAHDLNEQFGILYLTGWAPTAGETRPAGPVKGSY